MTREQIERMMKANEANTFAMTVGRDELRELCTLALEGLALRAENERLQRERDEALVREKTACALLENAETSLLKCEHREKEARAKALEEAAEEVRKQKAVFHSTEYAGGPLGAISESFACDRCEDAILALREKP